MKYGTEAAPRQLTFVHAADTALGTRKSVRSLPVTSGLGTKEWH